jgi:hypothetical protein
MLHAGRSEMLSAATASLYKRYRQQVFSAVRLLFHSFHVAEQEECLVS